jgi:hypothetical protein
VKSLVVALTAIAALTAPALAADMAAKAPLRAAPVAYAPSWTGCYVAGGGGYGMWNQENTTYDVTTNPRTQLTATSTAGGRGYFGTVGGGCDYQVPLGTWNFVVGAFGDYDFADMRGNREAFLGLGIGQEKLSSQWAVGGRVGVLVTPNLLTYFSAGYTEAKFDQINLTNNIPPLGAPFGSFIGSQTYSGYFLGAGDEYALSFLPGLFWKTEYRFSDFDTKSVPYRITATGLPNGIADDSHKYVHTIRGELVYRFNWGGPVVAKSAVAADLPARAYSKAPPPSAPVVSWTGCYIGGGGGYGLWNQENTGYDDRTAPRTQVTGTRTAGGRGYFGTVGGGCDYQFSPGSWNFVVGAFGDYDFASIKGNPTFVDALYGEEKLSSQWSVGGRVGVLVTPNLLTYFSVGYTEAKFDRINLLRLFPVGVTSPFFIGAQTYDGYFLGAGNEYALNFLPGLFWKTEYRFSDLGTKNNTILGVGPGGVFGASEDSHKYTHTVRSELVYRFNWGGAPIAAKY